MISVALFDYHKINVKKLMKDNEDNVRDDLLISANCYMHSNFRSGLTYTLTPETKNSYSIFSISMSRLYLQTLSLLVSDPALIYSQARPTAKSAMKVSSVSPER